MDGKYLLFQEHKAVAEVCKLSPRITLKSFKCTRCKMWLGFFEYFCVFCCMWRYKNLLWMVCMWRHQNSNFKTMSSMQLHVVYLCFMTTPNKFSQEISLISFTCPRDFGKVIGSRIISHVFWRVKLVHY